MALPRSLQVELETVTPLWMGGASYQTELRPPSMRGCLRFWLRALLGGVLGEALPDIRATEAAVYGDTTRASAVVVRLTGSPRTGEALVEKVEALPGLGYMYWSVIQQKRAPILAGERFHLRMQARSLPFPPVPAAGRTLDLNARFDLALASLWLMLRLGAVGARARRAGGDLRAVANPEGWPAALPPLASSAATPAEWVAELTAGLRQLRAFALGREGAFAAPAEPSSFDLLHEKACQLLVLDRTFDTWWEAVNWAGEKFQAFRVEQREDARGIAGLIVRGQLATRAIARAVLGLPLSFFFKTIHSTLVSQGVEPREARRRASATISPTRGQARNSPLFFRILPLAGATPRYALLLGLFRSRFLPDDEMTVRPGNPSIRSVRIEAPLNYALVDRWFQYITTPEAPLLPVSLTGPGA